MRSSNSLWPVNVGRQGVFEGFPASLDESYTCHASMGTWKPIRQGRSCQQRTDRIESKHTTPSVQNSQRLNVAKEIWAAVIAKVWLARRSRHVAPSQEFPEGSFGQGMGTNHHHARRLISGRRMRARPHSTPSLQFISLMGSCCCVPRGQDCGGGLGAILSLRGRQSGAANGGTSTSVGCPQDEANSLDARLALVPNPRGLQL